MHYLYKIIIIPLLIVAIFTSTISASFAAIVDGKIYSDITPESFSIDIKKIQNVFTEIGIYNGEIDGDYNNFKVFLADFQVQSDIISNVDHDAAGYIGPKTYGFLLDTYGDSFSKSYNTHFGNAEEITEQLVGDERFFVVTAYYSPLKGQKKYATGSYSGDIKLNGHGTHGASGQGVHPGFIAAPKTYSFGTKIELDGLGIGVVEDRGGAIVSAGNRGYSYDRLDIWMGYGDAGLARALQWGKRTVKGKIREKDTEITIDFNVDKPLSESNTENDNIIINRETAISLGVEISRNSSEDDIILMQDLFTQAGIYSGNIDGKYSSFKKAIIERQIKHSIKKSSISYGAGVIGEETLDLLEELHPQIFLEASESQAEEITTEIITEIITEESKIVEIIKEDIIEIEEALEIKEKSSLDPKIQKILDDYNITLEQKDYIEGISDSINTIFDKKYNGNNLKIISNKNKIRRNIDTIISSSSNSTMILQLLYLKELLNSK